MLAITLSGLLPSEPLQAVGFLLHAGLFLRTTTIHFSGFNTQPVSLIPPASDSRYRAYPQSSLPACRLSFNWVGLESFDSHPLDNINPFHPALTESPRFRSYLGMSSDWLAFFLFMLFPVSSFLGMFVNFVLVSLANSNNKYTYFVINDFIDETIPTCL